MSRVALIHANGLWIAARQTSEIRKKQLKESVRIVALSGGKAMGVATSMAAELQAFIEVSTVFMNCLAGAML